MGCCLFAYLLGWFADCVVVVVDLVFGGMWLRMFDALICCVLLFACLFGYDLCVVILVYVYIAVVVLLPVMSITCVYNSVVDFLGAMG